jgi:8-oxo-dGTP diphosphatase
LRDLHHPVWSGGDWIRLPVAAMGGEALVVPTVAGLVSPSEAGDQLLLQRRDKPGEVVRGLLEVPAGRWRAGETAVEALAREVAEETGLAVRSMAGEVRRLEAYPGRPVAVLQPAAVVVGVAGAYPALVLAFACVADGEPRGRQGESADPRWYPIEEVRVLLDDPGRFTGVAYAVLATWLGI